MAFETLHQLTQHQTILALVAAGLGVSLLPSPALSTLNLDNIATVGIFSPKPSREIGVFRRKGGEPSAAAREFLRALFALHRP